MPAELIASFKNGDWKAAMRQEVRRRQSSYAAANDDYGVSIKPHFFSADFTEHVWNVQKILGCINAR
jgi:hypothetical protein